MGATGVHAGWKEGVGGVSAYCTEHAGLIVLGWFIVFLAKCVRMTAGIVYTQRIRHYGVVEAPDHWKERIRSFCRDLRIDKPVELLESRVARMPMVIGHLKPVIFIPLGLLTQLPEDEIEAVLLHELAHIRRHDYFVNFLQHVAENLFFFNPGLLWISSLLREERENCCDDIAIARTNDKIAFVRALVSFKEYALQRKGLAMNFPSGRHQLLQRVLRITDNKTKTLNRGEKLFFLGSCLMVSVILSYIDSPGSPAGGHLYTQQQGPLMASETNREAGKSGVVRVVSVQERLIAGKGRRKAARVLPAKLEKEQSERAIPEREVEEEQVRKNEEIVKMKQDQSERDKLQAGQDILQVQRNREQVQRNREQAQRDQEQAQRDLVQAQRDKLQAERDMAQALKDRAQAARDKEQAVKDQQQADPEKKPAAEDPMKTRKAEVEKNR